MKQYISIKEAISRKKGEVAIHGWVHRERGSNERKFIQLRDSSGIIQCLIEKGVVGNEKKNKPELETLKRDISRLKPVIEKPFVRMTYDEALKKLKEEHNLVVEWGKDLRTLEEDALSKDYEVPVIVTHYPKKVKAFYMMESSDNPDIVLGFDVIAPEGHGEIIGGSQREHDINKIIKRLEEQGENIKDYEFYLDTRRYGSVPHGGFGLGVETLRNFGCAIPLL